MTSASSARQLPESGGADEQQRAKSGQRGQPSQLGQPGRRSIGAALRGMSLRMRVSVLVMLTVGLILTIGSIVSYAIVRNSVTNRLDDDLYRRATTAASFGFANPVALIQDQHTSATLTALGLKESMVGPQDGQYVAFKPPTMTAVIDGQSVTMDAAAPVGRPEVDVAAGRLNESARTVTTSEGAFRVVAVQVEPGWALVLATSMATTEATLHIVGLTSVLGGVLGIAIAGIAGFLVGRAALRPVERLTVATEYIARTGDLRRIEVTGNDELARLTTSFNTMLLALARSQEYQRRLVADAGHELRTPLTSIRTNLDLLTQAMAEPDNPRLSAQDRVDLMNDVRAQMDELSLLISDLVELSRDERPVHAIEQIDFAEVVERAVQRVQRRASSLTYDVQLTPWYLQGDPAALERAVTNLLDNAAKWSPPGGTVTVSLREGALQVADQGPGIADEDLPHIFERFYRSTEARTMPGSGLGLAIVRQVAENHGGRVAAARAPGGGALLGVWLPGVGAPAADPNQQVAAVSSPSSKGPDGPNGAAPAAGTP